MGVRTQAWTHTGYDVPEDRSGRDRELGQAGNLLVGGHTRLVTFTGPSGVGKTWAGHELRRRLEADAGWRTVTVEVGQARGFTELLQVLAGELGMPPAGGALAERVAAALASDVHLILLDGCERLLGSPHPVGQLLGLAPSLRVVGTSLRPLRVEDEHVVGLDPLDVPPLSAAPDELWESAAVQLFLRRARETDHGFDLERADVAAIAELCRRVHGLPLGIEIMATRVGSQPPTMMLEHLDLGREIGSLQLGGPDDPRHQSLESALAWSFAMLDPSAARVLRRMSVFAGPATLDMIAAVVPEADAEGDLHDAVWALVDHRLVDLHHGAGEAAFALVGLVRELAAERLVSEGEQTWSEDAHTRAVLDFALSRSDESDVADDEIAQADLARAEADLRIVLRRLVGGPFVLRGLSLATALAPFVMRRGYDGFVRSALESLLRRSRASDDPRVARGELWCARLTAQFDGPAAAGEVRWLLAEGLRRARAARDDDAVLLGLAFVMQTLPVTHDLAAAAEAASEGLPLAMDLGDDRMTARFLAWAAMIAHQTGQTEDAVELVRRGVELVEERSDRRAEILLMMTLAGLPAETAAPLISRLPPLQELLVAARRVDDARYEPFLLRTAAGLALRDGDLAAAAGRCAEALRLAHRQASWHDLPFTLPMVALVAAGRGDLAAAARFHGMVASRIDDLRPALPPGWVEDYLARLESVREELGGPAFDTAVSHGTEDLHANAIGEVLGYLESVSGVTSIAPASAPRASGTSDRPDPEHLTPRELEVLGELTTGATNKEISQRLGMAPKTVMHHSVAIYRKIGVRGRAEATAWAFRHGLAD